MKYFIKMGLVLSISLFMLTCFWYIYMENQTAESNSVDKYQENLPLEIRYDFGKKRLGERVEHKFFIVNPYPSPIRIKSFSTSCSCTVTDKELVGVTISPKDKISIPLQMTLSGRSDRLSSHAVIKFDNGQYVKLIIAGEVIVQHPSHIDLGYVRAGDRIDRVIPIIPIDQDGIKIKSARDAEGIFDIKFTQTNKLYNDYPTVHFSKIVDSQNIPSGIFSTILLVETDDEKVPIKLIHVKGYMVGDIEIKPKRILFDPITDNISKVDAALQIYSPYGKSIAINSITPQSSDLKVINIKNLDESNVEMVVQFNPKERFNGGQVFNSLILFEASIEDKTKQFSIEVYGVY